MQAPFARPQARQLSAVKTFAISEWIWQHKLGKSSSARFIWNEVTDWEDNITGQTLGVAVPRAVRGRKTSACEAERYRRWLRHKTSRGSQSLSCTNVEKKGCGVNKTSERSIAGHLSTYSTWFYSSMINKRRAKNSNILQRPSAQIPEALYYKSVL